LTTAIAQAQYNYAIGLRSGGTTGITLKKTMERSALEGIIGFWQSGLSVTALWEKKSQTFNEPGFNWFYGLGGHVAFYGDDFDGDGASWYDHPHNKDDGDLGLGIDGIVALEYKIPNVPIAFSLDLKPYIEITTEGGFFFSPDPGLGIKIAF
jgi:hypothetical protein